MKKSRCMVLAVLVMVACCLFAGCDEGTDSKKMMETEVFKARGKVSEWFKTRGFYSDVDIEISVVGTQYSDFATSSGNWELELPEGDWKLVISANGYLSEYYDIHLDKETPIEEIDTKLKPEIDYPVFPFMRQMYDSSWKNGDTIIKIGYDKYVEYKGIAYVLENDKFKADENDNNWLGAGSLNIIRCYNMPDWYNITPLNIEIPLGKTYNTNISQGEISIESTVGVMYDKIEISIKQEGVGDMIVSLDIVDNKPVFSSMEDLP
jgi:hypothetical protein